MCDLDDIKTLRFLNCSQILPMKIKRLLRIYFHNMYYDVKNCLKPGSPNTFGLK